MRFLANENFPRGAVTALRALGHEVAWVREDSPGASDEEILARADREAFILLTFDKDFGELAYHAGLPATCGIVLFRLPMRRTREGSAWLATLINSREDWAGRFTVIETGRMRMRDLPST